MLGTLLAHPLEEALGIPCLHIPYLDFIPHHEISSTKMRLILFDWTSQEFPNTLSQLEVMSGKENQIVALFNAPSKGEIENDALKRGFRGIFFQSDTFDNLIKGSRALLGGDLWFSRKAMETRLKEQPDALQEKQEDCHNLTDREKEILLKISSGKGNKEIANELNVSPHTVKTHIYNIFKKIEVRDRLQAALWVTKNL